MLSDNVMALILYVLTSIQKVTGIQSQCTLINRPFAKWGSKSGTLPVMLLYGDGECLEQLMVMVQVIAITIPSLSYYLFRVSDFPIDY